MFMAQVVDEYLSGIPAVLDGMRAALLANRPEDVALLAHKLKSSSGWLGADRLVALCAEMDMSARKGNLDGADERLRQVELEVKRVEQALRGLAAGF